MRNATRIDHILRVLRRAWRAMPDQRLAQLIVNASGETDPFYTEDEALLEGIARLSPSARVTEDPRDLIAMAQREAEIEHQKMVDLIAEVQSDCHHPEDQVFQSVAVRDERAFRVCARCGYAEHGPVWDLLQWPSPQIIDQEVASGLVVGDIHAIMVAPILDA